ncbi:agmatinase [Cribrihabitans marinus]|uniref:Agmatinase n=2 Tax=Cribrihabitans marinus TaxID=1227549 RepID=A0A1H7DT23_9RHOB|nr:agmatinase [Cribrihabitans marinus]SEK04688.1 agmatinase [Cribrihabitans marinus]
MTLRTLLGSAALAALLPCATLAQVMSLDEPDEQAPIQDGEEPLIRMNKDDPSYDVWKLLRDDLSKGREPGPINIQRLRGGFPWQGMPTFFHMPVALTPEDLKAGEVDIAIFGAEMYNGMRVQSYGPMEMRAPMKSEVYHNWGFHMPELDSGLAALDELNVVDYGNAPVHPLSMEISIPEVRKFVAEVAGIELENGNRTIPIIIGGGHVLMYPDAAGLTDVYGKGNLQIIHFDAHADQAPVGFGVYNTHGNPVRRLVEEGFINGEDIIQIGLRGPNSTDLNGVAWNRESGLRYHMMAEVERRGWQAVMDDVLAEARANGKPLFLSFDIDVVDPAFIPGTSTPEPGGMYMREALPLVRRICAENNLVGMEIVELRPERDPGYISVQNSKAILRQCLNGIAMAKHNLPDNYLHPDIVDDGK